jgi:proton-dependent oligopeptide transporter, POT family
VSNEDHHRPDPNKSKYALKHPHIPDQTTTGWPRGVPYIIGNEGCERFSFYGMRGILTQYAQFLILMYLTHTVVGRDVDCHHIIDIQDKASPHFQECKRLSEEAGRQGIELYHFFVTGVYAMGMIGSIIADRLWGKYRTILYLALVYCAGHAVLACAEGPIYDSILHVLGSNLVHGDPGYTQGSMWGLYGGLGLIAVGSGGIKPCVSAHVGDQFGAGNWFRVRSIFQYFYFIINVGSFAAILVIPWVWEKFGASLAFGIPGILMFLATFVFWLGRNRFVHVLPNPGGRLGVLDALSSIVLFMAVGNLFFTAGYYELDWYWCLLVSVGFLVLGGFMFRWRQSIEQDDGFLAVLTYAFGHRLFGSKSPPVRTIAAAGGVPVAERSAIKSPSVLIEETTKDVSPGIAERRTKLINSKLFGPAVQKFGIEAVEGPVAVMRIMTVFLSVSLFWACFDQHGSSWILQAAEMDLTLWGNLKVLPSQTSSVNPIMVMVLIPILTFGVYPAFEKMGFRVTALRRMSIGMFITVFSFVAVALIQGMIDHQGRGAVSIWWQVIPYGIITTAEVLVSVTGLEFAYTQAPKRMKSTIMGFWLLTVSLGNVVVVLISMIEGLSTIMFFWMFSGMTLVAAFIFLITAYFYKYQDYVQGEANPDDEHEETASGVAT